MQFAKHSKRSTSGKREVSSSDQARFLAESLPLARLSSFPLSLFDDCRMTERNCKAKPKHPYNIYKKGEGEEEGGRGKAQVACQANSFSEPSCSLFMCGQKLVRIRLGIFYLKKCNFGGLAANEPHRRQQRERSVFSEPSSNPAGTR